MRHDHLKPLIAQVLTEFELTHHTLHSNLHNLNAIKPAHCFGFRGMCADEIKLDYKVEL